MAVLGQRAQTLRDLIRQVVEAVKHRALSASGRAKFCKIVWWPLTSISSASCSMFSETS
jgi:hypothetical protein